MLGDVNRSLRPENIQIFLCKPNMETIAKLNEAFGVNRSTRLADLNELSFSLPHMVDIRGELVKNPNVEKIHERYLLRVEVGNKKEYYIITKLKDSFDEKEIKEVEAFSLGYELRDKTIRSYNKIGVTAKEAMTDALSTTIWDIGDNLNDSLHYFNTIGQSGGAGGRTFDVSSKTVLDFVIEIAQAYNAIIVWDTANRKVDFELPENIGQNRGLKISYGKYLQSLGRELNSDEMVTRFSPYGRDRLTIHSYNPTGSGYLEDFSFFMYPFQRDVNKNVVKSSNYMSDGLCNAILDYKELIEENEDNFRTFLHNKNTLQEQLDVIGRNHFTLETELILIQDRIDAKKAHGTYHSFQTTSSSLITQSLNADNYYGVMIRTTHSSITINGSTSNITPNKWTLFKINKGANSISVQPIAGETEVEIVDITMDEYNGGFTSTDINGIEITTPITDDETINKYCEKSKEDEIKAVEAEIDVLNANLLTTNQQIKTLQELIAVENNFTPQQLVERNQFIIEKEWTNDALMSSGDLYQEALKEFEKIREPQMVIDIDIINFLNVIEEQHNWKKLVLGDTITIAHERLGINVTAKIIEIEYDHEDNGIKLKIANMKDVKTDEDKFIETLYGAISTSTTVNMNKFKWDLVSKHDNDLNDLMNKEFDAVKQKIIAGTNESVEISRRGIMIKNPDDPDRYLVANHGVLAITRSGGKVWEHAITSDGIIGDRIIGKILIGQNLLVENSSGTFKVDENGVTITGTSLNIVAVDGTSSNINTKFEEGKTYADKVRTDIMKEIADVNDAIFDLDHTINTTFLDGVIDEAEKLSIKSHLDNLAIQKSDVDKRYDYVYANTYLSGIPKTSLSSAKTAYNTAHTNLVNAINTAISDSAVIDDERANVSSKFTAYNTALGELSTAFENAINEITKARSTEAETKAKGYADGLKTLIDGAIATTNVNLSNLNTYVDGSFHDGVIEEAEAKTIRQYLNTISNDKQDIDSRYNAIYANTILSTANKTALSTAKTDFNSKYTSLVNTINTAIADGKASTAEKASVDTAFTAYKTSLGTLSQRFEECIDNISANRESNVKSYVDTIKSAIDTDISQLNTELDNLNVYVDGSFADGIIEDAEKLAIAQHIDLLNSEKKDIDSRYTVLNTNADLTNKTPLSTAKTSYDSSHVALITAINTAIADSSVLANEKVNVASKFTSYRTALGNLSTAFENAINSISDKKKQDVTSYVDGLKIIIDGNINDVDTRVTNLNTYVDNAFHDGVIEEVEARAIEKYINQLNAEKEDVDKNYTTIYNNTYLKTSAVKTALSTAKTNYNTKHTALISAINTAIADGYTTTAEKTNVDTKFSEYRVELGKLRIELDNAVDDIAKNRSIEAEQNAKDFAGTESQAGKDAWGKFSGANNTLPAGNVAFNFAGSTSKGGNATNTDAVGNQSASSVQNATINFNSRNDRNSTKPNDPKVGTNLAGNPVDAIQHTINTDGSADISFEWDFDSSGMAGDIDGFIIFIMQASSSGKYSFGTSANSEQVYYVTPEKRAFILYGVPANRYYTFGIRAYRIVDPDINANEVIMSNIVKSSDPTEDPYRPTANVEFNGNIIGTISGENASDVVASAMNSIQEGVAYSNVTIDTTSGLVAVRNDNKIRTVLNATDGIKVQRNDGVNNWSDLFYADVNGQIFAKGLQIKSDDGTSVLIDAKTKTIDFTKFTTITGKLKADNVTVGASTTFETGYSPTEVNNSLRSDLNLASPVDKNVILINSSGITATKTGGSGYARLDHRGLYIHGGAIEIAGGLAESQINSSVVTKINNGNTAKSTIDTNKATWDKANTALQQATAYNGVKIDTQGLTVTSGARSVKMNASDGLIVHNGTEPVLYIDSQTGNLNMKGNIVMTSGSISWATIAKPTYTAEEVGARPDNWLPTPSQIGARPDNWIPTPSEVGAIAKNQTDVFNTLTNNGTNSGLFMSGSNLYLNASYIQSGIVNATYIATTIGQVNSTLTVGTGSQMGTINFYNDGGYSARIYGWLGGGVGGSQLTFDADYHYFTGAGVVAFESGTTINFAGVTVQNLSITAEAVFA